MSTEARHAPVPPRPSSPPAAPTADPSPQGAARTTPAPVPPARPGPGAGPSAEPDPGAGGTAAGRATPRAAGSGRGAGDPAGYRAAAVSADDPDDEPSVFAPRAPRPSPGAPAPDDRPHSERPGSETGTGPGPAFRRAAVPGFTDPVNPPPPPASARFPDTPPSTLRERLRAATVTRPGGGSVVAAAAAEPPAGTAGPLPPVRRPEGATREGAGAAQAPAGAAGPPPPARRPGGASARPAGPSESTAAGRPPAPAENFSETTARMRPSGPARRPGGPAGNPPAESPSETTTRLRPVPADPSPAPRRPGAPLPGSAPAGSAEPGRDSRGVPGTGAAARSTAAAGGADGWSPGVPGAPDPALSWSSGSAVRPVVSFGEPEAFGERTWPRVGPRTAAAAACLVLGLGLIGGAVTGSWLTGGDDDAPGNAFTAAGTLWHDVPVDQLFPPTVQGTGAGPGGADRTWTRIAVAPDSGCAHAFDPLLHKVLAPLGCRRLLRATYTDATQTYVTTVGLLFTDADPAAMSALARRFRAERLDRRADLMPRPYAAKGTAAAGFGDQQRASWTVSVLTDAPVVAYAVSGWADGRGVAAPQPAAEAVASGATTPQAQAGLGNEAQGLADRIERRLRQTVGSATERPS
ncbi:hypothetical protein ACIHEJ_21740 [Streptomyces sp. NPDC052301]|uniref:hypothetical protein n=1 Tax=Streptomyces sp. NPDC052301 TaxID=3365687 RepID=UPI0037D444CE